MYIYLPVCVDMYLMSRYNVVTYLMSRYNVVTVSRAQFEYYCQPLFARLRVGAVHGRTANQRSKSA